MTKKKKTKLRKLIDINLQDAEQLKTECMKYGFRSPKAYIEHLVHSRKAS